MKTGLQSIIILKRGGLKTHTYFHIRMGWPCLYTNGICFHRIYGEANHFFVFRDENCFSYPLTALFLATFFRQRNRGCVDREVTQYLIIL